MATKIGKEEWDPDMAEVLNCAFRGNVKVKTAVEVGKRAVEYFRGDDIYSWIEANKGMLLKKFPKLFEKNKLSNEMEISDFIHSYIQKGFFYRAQYKPIKGINEKDENGLYKRPKWPKRLVMTTKQNFDSTSFYILVYERNKKLQYAMLIGLIVVVLICCMFPVWPLKLKLSLWFISVVLMTAISAIIVGRLVSFFFFWFFGVDYWIFPNLFDEDCNVIESFYPIHSWAYRSDNWLLFFLRMFTAVLLSIGIHQLGKTHSVSDIKNFAKQSFIDILDWGHQKLAAGPENVAFYKSIDTKATFDDATNAAEEAEEEEDTIVYDEEEENYDCLKKCGFTTFEELVRECFLKCTCMEKVIKSKCFLKRCSKATKEVLLEAHKEACYAKTDD